MSKQQYIEMTTELLQHCNDTDFLDLLYKIACKRIHLD